MRLHARGTVINLALFVGALCLILYLNQKHPKGDRSFSWSRIHYQTTATSLPEVRGVCPGLRESTKPALIVSWVSTDGDRTWLEQLDQKYHLCIYTVDAAKDDHSTTLRVPANRGHEAMAYLTFIIDNYDTIPIAGAVFVHGSRWAWHNDHIEYDNAKLLGMLNVSAALEPLGYHNMRCDWRASTCAADYGPVQGSFETRLNAKLQPWDLRSVSDAALPHALAVLFGSDVAGRNTALGSSDPLQAQCCAQFVVSRERMRQHTRDEYVALRQWLLDGSAESATRNSDAAPADDRVAGRILSYIWHILFLPRASELHRLDELNVLACPSAADCYCRLYEQCGLDCPGPEQCPGQYTLPQGLKLADNWAATHS